MTNALIGGWRSGNYLEQPSPWSWAQNYVKSNDTSNALMQRMMMEAALGKMQQGGANQREAANNAAQMERLNTQQGYEDRRFDKGLAMKKINAPDGAQVLTKDQFKVMVAQLGPSRARQFFMQNETGPADQIGEFIYVKPKTGTGAGLPSQTPGQPAPAPGAGYQSVKP